MKIVESNEEWKIACSKLADKEVLVVPIFSDHKTHPVVNKVCVFGFFTDTDSFLVAFNHNEAINLDINILYDLNRCNKIWTPDKKRFLHIISLDNVYDVRSLEYLETGNVTVDETFLTPMHKFMYDTLDRYQNLNKAVAIMQHMSYLVSVNAYFRPIIENYKHYVDEPEYKFLNDIAIPCLWNIERNGLMVDIEKLIQHYGIRVKRYVDNSRVYSEYNLYTSTGRTSNKFGNINFAALNKKDGTREIFKSRFARGLMVMMDFESFHLRLIADIIGYEFPSDKPIHEYLGQQYFGKESLTEEEYEIAKQTTFALLYGESRSGDVPEFFNKVYQYIDMLNVLSNKNGYILSPYFKRKIYTNRIEDPTPTKLFNYIIQLAETERNLKVMLDMMSLFNGQRSVPVLYTYDSILLDYDISDGTNLIHNILHVLTENGKFPMRVYYGTTYNNMKRLNI